MKRNVITITKLDVQKMVDEIKNMKIKRCIWCKVAKDTVELHNIKCKTRNLLDVKVNKHVFRVSKSD